MARRGAIWRMRTQPHLCTGRRFSLLSDCGACQTVCLGVVFAGYVRDREVERAGQLAADPVQGVQSRAAAGILAPHLLDHNFGIRVDVKCLRSQGQSTLQGFKQGNILGYVVILAPNPFGDSDLACLSTLNDHPNAGRPRISQRAAIHVGYEIWHSVSLLQPTCDGLFSESSYLRARFPRNCARLCGKQAQLDARFSKHARFNALHFSVCRWPEDDIASKRGIDNDQTSAYLACRRRSKGLVQVKLASPK